MKCMNCWRDVGENFPDVVFNQWLKLMHYFDHEFSEDEISEKTYEEMVDALMSLKPWIEDGVITKKGVNP
uniref:Uncharacterized protein n=1 Tax=viral metagenome TaxID=1070528 RepID=A0A6M3KYW7_9ZZZZ